MYIYIYINIYIYIIYIYIYIYNIIYIIYINTVEACNNGPNGTFGILPLYQTDLYLRLWLLLLSFSAQFHRLHTN